MSKGQIEATTGSRRQRLRVGKGKDVIILSILALVLLIAVWRIFYTDEESSPSNVSMSPTEAQISRLLSNIQGVGEAEVMICETEDGVLSVVVVCEGANNLQVVMDVREAVAAALGTEEKAVKIYLKKV